MADGVRSDGYYQRYPGDYQRDTRGLSLAEHGAYNQLLDSYYSEEELSSDPVTLYRIAGAMDESERKAVDKVAKKYFTIQGERLIQERVERQLAARRAFIEDQSRKGKLSAESKKKKKTTETEPGSNHGSTGVPTTVQPEYQPEGVPKVNLASASASASGSGSGSETRSTPIAPTPEKSNGSGSKPKPWATLISWNRDKGCFEGISPDMIEKWEKAYPAVDLNSQLNRADEWLKANPTKEKKNYYRFVINWLSRAQERGGR